MPVSTEQLLNAGAHFGHLSRRWNPRMRKYIFMKRNGIHIIDLKKTQQLLEDAKNAVERIAASGGRIMFVGTKKQARDVIRDEALRAGTNYVAERWLGGMLTNFATIRKSLKRLDQIEKMESDGTVENLTKKERLMLSREKDRLLRVLGGIVDMSRLPSALFVVDIRKEKLAIKEAQTLGIPVIAIVDTNVDPTPIDYPIPANDDSLKTIALITKELTDAIVMGKEASRAEKADQAAAEESGKDREEIDEESIRSRRRTRSRRTKTDSDEAAEEKPEATEAEAAASTGESNEAPAEKTEESGCCPGRRGSGFRGFGFRGFSFRDRGREELSSHGSSIEHRLTESLSTILYDRVLWRSRLRISRRSAHGPEQAWPTARRLLKRPMETWTTQSTSSGRRGLQPPQSGPTRLPMRGLSQPPSTPSTPRRQLSR